MRKHRCPAGVNVARFLGMSGVSGSMIYDVMLAGLFRLRLGMSKARGRGRSTTLNCT